MPLSPDSQPSGEVCLPNINLRGRQRRLMAGVVQFVFCLAVLTVMIAFGVDRWWRLALYPMFVGAATGFFQWRDKT